MHTCHGEAAPPRDKAQAPVHMLADYYICCCWEWASLLWNVAAFLSGRGRQLYWEHGNVCVLFRCCAVTVPGWEGVVYLILRWPFPGDAFRGVVWRGKVSIVCCCLLLQHILQEPAACQSYIRVHVGTLPGSTHIFFTAYT